MEKIKYISVLIIIALVMGCISAPQPPAPTPAPANNTTTVPETAPEAGFPPEMEIMGAGESPSLLGSMQGAKADAIKKGVIEIIGASEERANSGKLESVLYSTKNQNSYVEMIENTRKDKIGDNYIYEARFLVKLAAIESTLKAQGIIKGGTDTPPPSTSVDNNYTVEDVDIDEVAYEEPTEDEKKFIARYVDKMTFLVYFEEGSKEEDFYQNGALTMANEFILTEGLNTVDLDQVNELKKDQQSLFEGATGESMSVIQWIAQKLNADIYIEIAGTTTSQQKMGGKYYGTANLTLKAFEASTGDLVGSVAYNLPQQGAAYSTVSVKDARLKAIQAVVYTHTMPRLITQVKTKMKQSLLAGIKYDVVIQVPPNDREMSKFWKEAKKKLESFKTIYQSESEVKYSVWFIGGIEDLKEVFYDASEGSDLEDMYAVAVRGKSITFNSGL